MHQLSKKKKKKKKKCGAILNPPNPKELNHLARVNQHTWHTVNPQRIIIPRPLSRVCQRERISDRTGSAFLRSSDRFFLFHWTPVGSERANIISSLTGKSGRLLRTLLRKYYRALTLTVRNGGERSPRKSANANFLILVRLLLNVTFLTTMEWSGMERSVILNGTEY